MTIFLSQGTEISHLLYLIIQTEQGWGVRKEEALFEIVLVGNQKTDHQVVPRGHLRLEIISVMVSSTFMHFLQQHLTVQGAEKNNCQLYYAVGDWMSKHKRVKRVRILKVLMRVLVQAGGRRSQKLASKNNIKIALRREMCVQKKGKMCGRHGNH